MQQRPALRPTNEPTPDDQDQARADVEETLASKRVRDGLIAWNALAALGRSLTVAAEARARFDVLDLLLRASANYVFLEWQSAGQHADGEARERLAEQWAEIRESRRSLERLLR